MHAKRMTLYWIFSVLCSVGVYVGATILLISLSKANEIQNPLELIFALYGLLGWVIILIVPSIVQFIIGIIHIVNYCKNNFISRAKVGHALYQLFFGLGIIGMIIVLAKHNQ
ncbi:MAG: hypothetical protein WC366_01520 [Bacilli bacterium]|jgi:signal transduction histidine kinase